MNGWLVGWLAVWMVGDVVRRSFERSPSAYCVGLGLRLEVRLSCVDDFFVRRVISCLVIILVDHI